MSPRLFFWSLTAAFAGFLFGFDTVVISGAEGTIQALWKLSPQLHGFAIGSALWGPVVGSLVGGWPTDRYGRRGTLIWIGVLYFVSAVWSGLATDVYSFMIARFIGGLGVGISTVAAPLYIAEISPPAARGRLTALFQFNIVLGILIAYVSNAALASVGEYAWRWMLGVEAFPALLYTVLTFTLPESPRWLIALRGEREAGLNVLRLVRPEATEQELEQVADEIEQSRAAESSTAGFWSWRLRTPIMLAFLVAFFNQMSGVNAILYFAPRIFELAGYEQQAALLTSVGVGVTNLIFTFVGLWLIDRLGRRTLLIIGSFGYLASLGLCSWSFYSGNSTIVPACVFAFIAAHAIGQGTVIWVLIAEVFPNQFRAAGQSLGSFTHWIFAALVATFFPIAVAKFEPGAIFAFFTGMMALQLVWVLMLVPETKGVPLEEMSRRLGIEP
jgi:SP family arabinose:H+ symporter-like MFS transporter